MRRIVKRIIKSVEEYDEAMWGDGGYYDSLAGEEIGFHSDETENKANKAWNDLKSIYGTNKGIPSKETLLRHGLNKEKLDIINGVIREIKKG